MAECAEHPGGARKRLGGAEFYYRRAQSHDEDVTVPARSVALMVTCKQ